MYLRRVDPFDQRSLPTSFSVQSAMAKFGSDTALTTEFSSVLKGEILYDSTRVLCVGILILLSFATMRRLHTSIQVCRLEVAARLEG